MPLFSFTGFLIFGGFDQEVRPGVIDVEEGKAYAGQFHVERVFGPAVFVAEEFGVGFAAGIFGGIGVNG